jgi:hypothetical protein
MQNNTFPSDVPPLLEALFNLLDAHRPAFQQGRVFYRSIALAMATLFSFGRHTVTQLLLSLGVVDADWSAFYRIFSQTRYEAAVLERCFFRQTLAHVAPDEPYVVAVDCVQIPRSSLKMPGTSWLKAPRTPAFRPGIHRAQRFMHGAWLTPLEDGFSRAIPLRFMSAFPAKAVPASEPPRKEWEAGRDFLAWVRAELDACGRVGQPVLALGDGNYDTLELWRSLPPGVSLAARTARNRRLYELPPAYAGRGRPAEYGPQAPHPADWLHEKGRWSKRSIRVRGRNIEMAYRVKGPYLREGLPGCPLFLIVVRGIDRMVGSRKRHRMRRDPCFYLVSAVECGGVWRLPWPEEMLLAWLWQRWEVEVAHREMKSGLGVGEMQCWNTLSAVRSVQWSAWVYSVLLLAGYRTWGLLNGPGHSPAWQKPAQRWSFNTLWRAFRAALWGKRDFQASYTGTADNWQKMEALLAAWLNATLAAARS